MDPWVHNARLDKREVPAVFLFPKMGECGDHCNPPVIKNCDVLACAGEPGTGCWHQIHGFGTVDLGNCAGHSRFPPIGVSAVFYVRDRCAGVAGGDDRALVGPGRADADGLVRCDGAAAVSLFVHISAARCAVAGERWIVCSSSSRC